MLTNREIIRTQTVEIFTNSDGQQTINIPDIQNLRDVYVWGIEFYYGETRDEAFKQIINTPTDREIYSLEAIKRAYLTLQDYNGFAFVNQAPILNLIAFGNELNFSTTVWKFTGQKINWNKSFIFFNNSNVALTKYSFLMNVYYSLDLKTEETSRKANLINRS